MKLSKSKLEEIRRIIESRNAVAVQIGNMEVQKLTLIDEAFKLDFQYNGFKTEMEERYGEGVQVDLKDGSITEASNDLKADSPTAKSNKRKSSPKALKKA